MARTSGFTRPSKLRLPESTDTATRSLSLIAFETFSGSGPELPMQVVQPKPTRLKPSASRSPCRPAFLKYSSTICEPGASEVFTHGLDFRPFCDRVAGEKAGADHHARVRGVGAGGDRGDHHVAVAEIVIGAVHLHALADLAGLAELLLHGAEELGLGGVERHAVLRALRAGKRGHHVAEIEFERVGEDRVGACRRCATCPAPWHRPRPARRARRCGSWCLR